MIKKCIKCKVGIAQTKKRPYCKPCRNKIERDNYDPKKDRARHIKYWYGITTEEADRMLIVQNHQCPICGVDLRKEKKINIDHNHKTGKVRAILCTRCNLSIGLLENEKWIIKALKYLKKHI